MSLNHRIFGWVLMGIDEYPLAHHAGIILSWNEYDLWGTIVAHYGCDSIGTVRVETLGEAVKRAEVTQILINDSYEAVFEETPYYIDDDGIHPGRELIEYERDHPHYDIWKSNCQHFVQHFVGNVPIESNIYADLDLILRGVFAGSVTSADATQCLTEMMIKYEHHRSGVCRWNRKLDIYVG